MKWEEGEEERRDQRQRGQRRRMEKREPDVGIAVGALQPYGPLPLHGGHHALQEPEEEGDDRVSL